MYILATPVMYMIMHYYLFQAAQCTELDVLIPLKYMCSKLVLVGDPLQLPAVVKSQEAAKYGFRQSLFERFYKHFHDSTNQG